VRDVADVFASAIGLRCALDIDASGMSANPA
jgi:hypothetical protein